MAPTNYQLGLELRRTFENGKFKIPLFTGDLTQMQTGLAYHLVRTHNRSIPDWFLWKLDHLKEQVAEQQGLLALAVHWPKFLAQAALPATALTSLAHKFLEALLPRVDQFDVLLADDLRLLRERFRGVPSNLWDVNEVTTKRFNAHLKVVLSDDKFMKAAQDSVERALRTAVRPASAVKADELTQTRPILRRTTFLENQRLHTLTASASFEALSPEEKPTKDEDHWHHEVRRLADSFCGHDGVWYVPGAGRRANQLLVNWEEVVRQAREANRSAPFLGAGATGEEASVLLGASARAAFATATRDRFLSPRHGDTLAEVVERVAKVTLSGPQQCWELYAVAPLERELAGFPHRVASLKKRTRLQAARARAPKKDHFLFLEYQLDRKQQLDPVAADIEKSAPQTHLLAVMRYGKKLFFQVPYPVPDEFAERPELAGHHRTHAQRTLWTLAGIAIHAEGLGPAFPRLPDAAAFHVWANEQNGRLLPDEAFGVALFEQNHHARLAERARGARKHLGPFTSHEDAAIRAFCEQRARGPLNEHGKQQFMDAVPGRTINALMARREHLAFEFALKFGWVAYAQSGYCGVVTAARRKEWLKKGVPVLTPHEKEPMTNVPRPVAQ